MSGHSKWSTIKHKKAAADAKRGRIFSRLSKEITVAAKTGGGDIEMNPRLRSAVDAAKNANMPSDNIDRAIKKGTGELPGVTYEEVIYEAYGPGGVGLIIETLTDNKNRTIGEVRSTIERRNGHFANAGAVAWQFNKKGFITVPKEAIPEDDLFLVVTEAGAEDMTVGDEAYEITCEVDNFEDVKSALKENDIKTDVCELTMLPASTIKLTNENEAGSLLRLIEAIEELDDVQNIYANFDMDTALMEKLAEEE